MNKKLFIFLPLLASLTLSSCTTTSGNSEANQSEFDEFDQASDGEELASAGDEFADEELESDTAPAPSDSTTESAAAAEPVRQEESLAISSEPVAAASEDTAAEVTESQVPPSEIQDIPEPVVLSEESKEPPLAPSAPDAIAEPTPVEPVMPEAFVDPGSSPMLSRIQGLRFRGFENGGTLIIEGNQPLSFRTRVNEATNQFVIEVPQSELAPGVNRPMITKDMESSIGSVDAYQSESQSQVSNIVVQLKPGSKEPYVTREGNNILVVAQGASDSGLAQPQGLLSSATLDDFLNNNTKFYGKKISIETQGMSLGDVIRLISEESGVNIIVGAIPNTPVNIRLRQVPWDQALAILLRTHSLGYTRIGDVLRVATLSDIRTEEKQAIESALARKVKEPLRTRMIPINFAEPSEIAKQLQDGATGLVSKERGGSVIENKTPKSLIITETVENLDRITKVVRALDVPPRQVLIEGKIIEATENFQRSIGVNWFAPGQSMPIQDLNGNRAGLATVRPTIGLRPGDLKASSANLGLEFGSLEYLGSLSAQFSLFETQGLIDVLASPRILTKDGQSATMTSSSSLPVSTSTQNGGVTQITTSYVDFPLSLNVKPSVKNDGSVEMEIKVERSVPILPPDGGSPSKSQRSASTNVLVRNGQTAVIGGLYQSDEVSGQTKVPGLGSIPFIGWLFRTSNLSKSKTELMIFVTPKVITHDKKELSSDSVDL